LQDIAPVLSNRKNSPASVLINNGDTFFGGNGSLISTASHYPYSNVSSISNYGYGRKVDDAVYLNGYASKAYFQVYKEDTSTAYFTTDFWSRRCSKIRVSSPNMRKISWKNWESAYPISGVSTNAPTYDVYLPKEKGWYIIDVESGANAGNNQYVNASCVQ
jgi:hypothetical protein